MPASMAELIDGAHVVQFYADDAVLVDVVSRPVGAALVTGDAAIVFATERHQRALDTSLRARGLDVTVAAQQGRYVPQETSSLLGLVMRSGRIDRDRFRRVMSESIARVRAAAGVRRILIFGELVGVLMEQGNIDAALDLEARWNELARTERFALCCAYRMNDFRSERRTASFLHICGQHSHVFPAERRARSRSSDRETEAGREERRAERHAREIAVRQRLLEKRRGR